jgi:nucleotide-binding universal stress UspA family protein
MTFKNILVALELSPRDESVFSEALSLAQNIGASLTLIHCLSDLTEIAMMSQTGMDSGMGLSGIPGASSMSPAIINMDLIEDANITKHQQAEKHLGLYQKQASSQGIPVKSKCYESTENIGSQICQIARDLNVDLIVIGRKKHNDIAEALLGSVSNHVLHHAPCPILVIQ